MTMLYNLAWFCNPRHSNFQTDRTCFRLLPRPTTDSAKINTVPFLFLLFVYHIILLILLKGFYGPSPWHLASARHVRDSTPYTHLKVTNLKTAVYGAKLRHVFFVILGFGRPLSARNESRVERRAEWGWASYNAPTPHARQWRRKRRRRIWRLT